MRPIATDGHLYGRLLVLVHGVVRAGLGLVFAQGGGVKRWVAVAQASVAFIRFEALGCASERVCRRRAQGFPDVAVARGGVGDLRISRGASSCGLDCFLTSHPFIPPAAC